METELLNKIEQYRRIVAGAPDGATHYAPDMHYLAYNNSGNWMRYEPNLIGGFCWFAADDFKFSYTSDFQSLDTLRTIIDLHDENLELAASNQSLNAKRIKNLKTIVTMHNDNVKLREALSEMALSLEHEINARYKGLTDYPSMQAKYERDMEEVNEARELLK